MLEYGYSPEYTVGTLGIVDVKDMGYLCRISPIEFKPV